MRRMPSWLASWIQLAIQFANLRLMSWILFLSSVVELVLITVTVCLWTGLIPLPHAWNAGPVVWSTHASGLGAMFVCYLLIIVGSRRGYAQLIGVVGLAQAVAFLVATALVSAYREPAWMGAPGAAVTLSVLIMPLVQGVACTTGIAMSWPDVKLGGAALPANPTTA